jgi:hypothetical protein
MKLSPCWQVSSCEPSQDFVQHMELGGSLPYSQEHSISPYFEPDQRNAHNPNILSKKHPNIIY